ncbi:MAG: hypothetical protein HUN04_10060 [Desulfobacter sp.]|nr:MAG: hypothetical protein HUN04_10060 [Desulfobacter sp.]
MFSVHTLQAKLMVSVFLIVILTAGSMTALVIYTESNKLQTNEMERIFYKADAMRARLGHLMYGKNWRYLMMTLSNAKAADPSMLYFSIIDDQGRVLIADDDSLVGQKWGGHSTPMDPDRPLYSKEMVKKRGQFRIFLSQYPVGEQSGDKVIFEAVYEIVYLGQPMGTFRAGFSRKGMVRHLQFLTLGMVAMGGLVLLAVLGIMYLVIRRHMVPVESFTKHISGLDLGGDGRGLRSGLADLQLEEGQGETRDVRLVKQAFAHMRNQFISAWDQLENHRDNLEQMVDERTKALNRSNEELSRQIKERKEIESRILTVQKLEAIGTLAGGVAHEFNNLFMAITGYATLIQKRSAPGHPNIEKAEKIRDLVENGSRSVQQLLGFARSGKFSPGPLSLNEILSVSLAILSAGKKSLIIEAGYEKDLWMVQADRSQMEQVSMNLLLNAVEAVKEGGTIRVSTRNVELEKFQVSMDKQVSGRYAVVEVRDGGTGIDPDILPRIFDPFFTTKAPGQGSGMGMGLASVFGIVDNHGGFTTVDSKPGRGSTFCVYLPAMDMEKPDE